MNNQQQQPTVTGKSVRNQKKPSNHGPNEESVSYETAEKSTTINSKKRLPVFAKKTVLGRCIKEWKHTPPHPQKQCWRVVGGSFQEQKKQCFSLMACGSCGGQHCFGVWGCFKSIRMSNDIAPFISQTPVTVFAALGYYLDLHNGFLFVNVMLGSQRSPVANNYSK